MDPLESFDVKTINDLPHELVLRNEIFKRLSLADLLNAKLVCKLWNWLISSIRIERLFADADLDVSERWFHSKKPCSESELCSPDLFVDQCKKPILSNLKYLKLNNRILWPSKLNSFNPNALNAFRQLIQLEIDHYLGDKLHLCLPDLVVLSLNWSNNKCHIKLDLPKLRVLGYDERENHNLLRVERPETVRVLESQMFGAKLARFKNVEYLRCAKFDHGFLDRSTLLNLKQLKEVHYDLTIDCFENDGYEEVMQALKDFLKQKRKLGRSDLKVYFSGLQLIEEDLSDVDFGLKIKNGKYLVSTERLYMKHYGRLKNDMGLVWEVDYSLLFRLVDELPRDYFNRFNGLRSINAHCPVDEKHFLEFLKKLYCLRWFTLYGSNLSQAFFDSLPEFCSLTHLYLRKKRYGRIKDEEDSETSENDMENEEDNDHETNGGESEEDEETQLNFNFLGEFVNLYHAAIEKSLSLESIRSFVPAFGNLKKTMDKMIEFKYQGNEFVVGRNRPDYDDDWKEIINERYNTFYLSCGEKLLVDYVNLDQVVDFFEKPENLENLCLSDDSSNSGESSSDSDNPGNSDDEGQIENS